MTSYSVLLIRRSTGWFASSLFSVLLACAATDALGQDAPSPDEPVLGMLWSGEASGPVTVQSVEEGSAAAAAGLQEGDVIRTINKSLVSSSAELTRTLNNLRGGEKVALGVLRGRKAVQVVLSAPQTTETPTRIGLLGAMLKLEATGQMTVSQVAPGTAAEAGGLAPGDVLVSVNGFKPATVEDLTDFLTRTVTAANRTSDELEVTVLREEEEQKVVLALPEPGATGASGTATGPARRTVVLGVVVAETEGGLVVTEVLRGSPAERAGIRVGDAILAVEEQKVPTYAGLAESVKAFRPGEKVNLDVLRDGKAFVAAVTPIASEARLPDVALATGASDANPPAVELQAQVAQLQQRVDELSATVETLVKEISLMRQQAQGGGQ